MTGHFTIDGRPPIDLTGTRYLIGRGDGCEILLPEGDGAVSRRHALMERDPHGAWSIVDLGSRNGTLVNGGRIADRHTLADGDRIGIGKSQILIALPRSQPTIAVDAPFVEPSLRGQPTIAAAPVTPRPPLPPAALDAAWPPEEPDPVIERPEYHRPAPPPEPHIYQRPDPAPAPDYAEPRKYPEAPVITPPAAAPASPGMGLIITGVALVVVSALAYFGYVEPKLEQYQSVLGQIAGGLMSLFGNQSMQQELQTLAGERIACIVGGFGGAGLILAGVLKRR